MITPNDHISHDLSYICGPRTSGAVKIHTNINSTCTRNILHTHGRIH